MPVEKSSSTKKTNKVTKAPSSDPMKGPAKEASTKTFTIPPETEKLVDLNAEIDCADENGVVDHTDLLAIPDPIKRPDSPLVADEEPELVDVSTEDKRRILDLECQVAELNAGVSVLMDAISKFAVLSGHGNHLKGFGIKRWEPGQRDMTKFG
ncbi:MAG: hypothetical protein COB84_01885 [Rhodobacteraceae bacterium]|nr:MAG: hypothetical protein COB84_01885 [Paracoccaceae bacterium]